MHGAEEQGAHDAADGHQAHHAATSLELIAALCEANLDIGTLLQVDAVDEADLPRRLGHDHGGSSRALTEEAHAAHQRSVGDAGGGEDELLAGSKIVGGVN